MPLALSEMTPYFLHSEPYTVLSEYSELNVKPYIVNIYIYIYKSMQQCLVKFNVQLMVIIQQYRPSLWGGKNSTI